MDASQIRGIFASLSLGNDSDSDDGEADAPEAAKPNTAFGGFGFEPPPERIPPSKNALRKTGAPAFGFGSSMQTTPPPEAKPEPKPVQEAPPPAAAGKPTFEVVRATGIRPQPAPPAQAGKLSFGVSYGVKRPAGADG
jgi:hypothetical protein